MARTPPSRRTDLDALRSIGPQSPVARGGLVRAATRDGDVDGGRLRPHTSSGILHRPHPLAFYACFFFFGVATFAAEGLDMRLGGHRKPLLPAAIVLLLDGPRGVSRPGSA